MATKNINGIHTKTILVQTSGNIYNVKEDAVVIAGSMEGEVVAAIMENPEAMPLVKNNVYNIDGQLVGSQVGIYTQGMNNEIHVGDTGQVSGGYGIAVAGKNTLVTNSGQVLASASYGIYGLEADGLEFRNTGTITGGAGMFLQGSDESLMINGAEGVIVAAQYGMAISSDAGEQAKVINHGSVVVNAEEGAAIASGEGDETVINDGVLKGSVILGGGDDSLDNRGGTIKGSIVGGAGDDVLIVDDAKYKLVEVDLEGTDTVRSSVNYTLSDYVEKLFLIGNKDINGGGNAGDNILHGNSANNELLGKGGMDDLFGHKGNDKLTGGAAADTFHFSTGDANDRVMDFNAMLDKIDVSDWNAISDFGDVQSHAHNQGDDVIIEAGNDTLLIKGLHKADLADGYFEF